MRVSPAPSPTTGSQSTSLPHSSHISSTVGAPSNVVMSPHPVPGQSENRNSNSMHSPGYATGGPPHMAGGPQGPHGYPSKMSHMSPGPPAATPYGQPGYQQGPGGHQYPSTRPQGHIMQGPYSQNYPPSGAQGPQGAQYPPRPPHNSHVPPNQPYGYSHFGQQGWGQGMAQPMLGSGMPGKGGPSQIPGQPTPGPPGSNSVVGPRPQHYIKQHIQHKIGGYQPSTGPQMYPNGPGMPPGIVNNNREIPQNNMPPPTSTPQPLTLTGAPSLEVEQSSPQTVPSSTVSSSPNVTNNSGSTNNLNNSVNSNPPQIGPDGNPMVDEASQQSTVSNTSAASGDDRSCTPKPHKENLVGSLPISRTSGGDIVGGAGQHAPSHTPTPLNSAPSPGTASMTSQQDEFETANSPGWPRSPTGTPVYANSQPPPPTEIYRTTKPGDSIMRLYEMSDSPERRAWLDKLLRFMEENKTPITACPTISKNPLDLYALYLHVRERGGFEEVTKNKHWKDVAAVMGIGASSSGSYTLRRHYMKHILAFECKFDRGGVDPQPIINQIESSQKKKTSKTLSVPSPGSNSSSMDGFTNGPHIPGAPGMPGPYSQYPPSSEFPGHMQQRPPNQSTPGYQGFQGGQFPGYQGMHSGYGQASFPPNSGYSPDNRSYQAPPPSHQGNFQGFQQPGYQRPGFPPPPPPQPGYQPDQYPMGNSGGSTTNYGGSQLAKQLLNPPPRSTGPVLQGFPYPPKPGTSPSPGPPVSNSTTAFQGPRRHPDFEKGQPGWRPPSTQFGSYGSQGPAQMSAQQPWSRGNEASAPPTPSQWNQPRYPPPPSQSFPSQPRWPSNAFGSSVSGPRAAGAPPGNKGFMSTHATSFKSTGYGTYMGKQLFPMDSVEAVSPVLVKRKRMTRSDIPPVDPWRLLMSLRCGLASEVTWALDVLNILLFDDQTVVYFGLNHMPGLLETLIEHLRRGLINMFNICSELELGKDDEATGANKRVKAEQHDYKDRPWFERPPPSPSLELDLGRLDGDPDPLNKDTLLKGGVDYTVTSRNGKPVRIVNREGNIFMKEGSREWDKWEGYDSGVDTWSVGGGECTAHIICSMQSSVTPIPFTRLLPEKRINIEDVKEIEEEDLDPDTNVPLESMLMTKTEKECRQACVTSQCVIKIEKMDTSKTDKFVAERIACKESEQAKIISAVDANPFFSDIKLASSPKTVSVNAATAVTTPSISPSDKDINMLSDKCNGPKESSNKPIFSPKFNRKNNAKTSKLDAIVKRIKKEPIDSNLSIFGRGDKDMQTDSKSILDLYLKKEEPATETEKSDALPLPLPLSLPLDNKPCLETKPEVPTSVTSIPTYLSSCKNEVSNKNFVSEEAKLPVKSPVKLLSLPVSPIKISNSSGNRKENVGFKRPYEDLEEESWSPDEASLTTTTEGQDWLARRVVAVGTVVRNLSFIPGNEDVMSKSASLLALLGKTILLHHDHPVRSPTTTHYDRDEETDFSDWCSSLASDTFWWWPYLHHVHENTLVTLANMAGHLDLSYYPEEISRPILNGLLHWATCPASYGQDAIPGGGVSIQSALSPQRLALEALVKLCVLDPNTDLVLATPPFSRLDMLCGHLTRLLCRGEDQVTREFAVNLFHYFSAADSGVARVIAMQNGCVSLLVAFIEEAESAALNVANIQGVSALKENPELMGTSLDMVRRSANTLVNLSKVPDNARVITACENRFLTLVMSQILDTYVASQLSQVLFNVAQVQSDTLTVAALSPPLSPLLEENDLQANEVEEDFLSTESKSKDKKSDKETRDDEDDHDNDDEDDEKKCESVSKSIEDSNPQITSFQMLPSTTSSSSCTSTTSSASSPMSVTSHPPLSPSTSLPLSSPCVESTLNPSKAAAAAPAPQQATQTL